MQIYQSNFQTIEYFEDKNMLRKSWTTKTADMTEEDFQYEVTKIAEMVEKVKPLNMCDVTANFSFTIDTAMQSWVDSEIFPRFLAAGLRRYALIMSTEFIAQLSIEQTMDERQGLQFQTKYFDNEEEAVQWLIKA